MSSSLSYIDDILLNSLPECLIHFISKTYDIRLNSQTFFNLLLDTDKIKQIWFFQFYNDIHITFFAGLTSGIRTEYTDFFKVNSCAK